MTVAQLETAKLFAFAHEHGEVTPRLRWDGAICLVC